MTMPDLLGLQGEAFRIPVPGGEQTLPPRVDGDGVPATVQDLYLQRRTNDPDGAEQFLSGFYAWALSQGVVGDPNDPDLSRAYVNEILGTDQPAGGGAGRTIFPSEVEANLASAELARQRAQSEVQQRQLLEQQSATSAFSRARDKFVLMQTADQLADARREAATEALIAALPFMVNAGQQFTPGFEPGGAGPALGSLLGADVPARQLPTAELPLNELANPPLSAPPEAISAGLGSLL